MNEEIHIMLFPTLLDEMLLLPNVSVAEVVNVSDVILQTLSDDCLCSHFLWRGVELPLMCLEAFEHGKTAKISAQSRIAVLHRQGDTLEPPFYGVLLQGLPRIEQITWLDIRREVLSDTTLFAYEIALRSEQIFIPDFQAIESRAGFE